MKTAPHTVGGVSASKRLMAGLTALMFMFSSIVQAAPDGSFTTQEKARIKAEIQRVSKLNQNSCQPVENTLRGLEKRLTDYEATRKSYLDAYQKQRESVLELWRPFLPAAEYVKQKGEGVETTPSVVDDYAALVSESRKSYLYTEMGPMDGDKPGETVDWVFELEYAWDSWKGRGGKSPDTRDKRYFFEGPEQLSGNVKATLGPLAQQREDLRVKQGKIHDDYRKALQALRNKLTGTLMAVNLTQSQTLVADHSHLEDIRTRLVPQLLQEIEAQAASGEFEHCYGILPADAARSVGQLPWVVQAGKLTQLPKLTPIPLPDPGKLPQALPRVLLKMDGVEHYLRTRKMFAEQAKVDLEYSKLSVVNAVEGTWDVISGAGVHIYHAAEGLVMLGVKVADTAVADLQAIVNLSAYGVGIEDAALWDPTGAVARNKEWAGKVNKAIEGVAYDVGKVCATMPPESCVAATVLYPVMKPTFAAMEKLGQAMPKISESVDNMVAALSTSQSDLDNARDLSDFQRVRDQAARIEQGAADLRQLTGVVTGEVLMNLALGAGIARMATKAGETSLTGAEVKALFESYQQAGEQAQVAITRLSRAAGKMDDIALAAKNGKLTVSEANEQMARVGEMLRANKLEYEATVRGLPPEARQMLDKTYARGVEALKSRMTATLKDSQLDALVSGQTEVLDYAVAKGLSQTDLLQLEKARTELLSKSSTGTLSPSELAQLEAMRTDLLAKSASRTLSPSELARLEQYKTELIAKSPSGTLGADELAQLERMETDLISRSASRTLTPSQLAALDKYKTELIARSSTGTLGPSELAQLERMETELLAKSASRTLTPSELAAVDQFRTELVAKSATGTLGPEELAKLEQFRTELVSRQVSKTLSESELAVLEKAKTDLLAKAGLEPGGVPRPVVDQQAADIFSKLASQPAATVRPATGQRLDLNLPALSGQYKVGEKLGAGGFKEVFVLADEAGRDTGKVIAFLDAKDVAKFKSFMGSELYSKTALEAAQGLPHVVPEAIAQLPDGRWVMTMDNFSAKGISVGESLADDAYRASLRNKFLSDPALNGEVERFAATMGKTPAALSNQEFQQLAAKMAAQQDMESRIAEQLALPGNAGKTRAQIIAEYGIEPVVETRAKSIAEFTEKNLGVAWELPPEAQEAAFKYMIRSTRQGISQLDFKPGNIGFVQGKSGLEMIQTDLGGTYVMSDEVARKFVSDLGEGVVREQQRMQAALKQVVETGESKNIYMAIQKSGLDSMPLTAGASKQTFTGKYFEALRRLAENPKADISDLVGSELNQFVKNEVASIGPENPILSKMGQGLEPGKYVGRKGLDVMESPVTADAFLDAREAAKSPPRADVEKLRAAEEALKRAEEQKAATQLEEAGTQQKIREGMCTQIESKILGGATATELDDLAGRGFGCDPKDLKKLKLEDAPVDPNAPTEHGAFLELPRLSYWQSSRRFALNCRAANASCFRRAA